MLDSEGIGSADAEGLNDNQVFTLTVLLSSVLIYNSKNVPKRYDLEELRYPFPKVDVIILLLRKPDLRQ